MGKKLYVGNVSWSFTSEDLRDAFAEAGEVVDAQIIMDRIKNRSKGFGFVEFATEEEAAKAKEMFDGKDIGGRELKVDFARPPQDRE